MRITGAAIYDPASGRDGEIADIFISDGKIADHSSDGNEIDATGLAAMAGGIDPHSHLLGASSVYGATPETFAREYLRSGYTWFVEAGLPVETAEKFRHSESSLPVGYSILQIAGSNASGASGLFSGKKYVGEEGLALFFDSPVSDELRHIHLPHLARPGNFEVLKNFLSKSGGRKCHIAHIHYYLFGEKADGKPHPVANEAISLLKKYPEATFDLGPPVFGKALTFTRDGELAEKVASSTSSQTREAGAGYRAVDYEFRQARFIDSLFWVAAMEMLLGFDDLSRVSLSIDFPSGGSIEGYPLILAMLTDAELRNRFASTLNMEALSLTDILENDRELSLGDIASVTRSSPARACSLAPRGSLAEGTPADMVLYNRSTTPFEMFRKPAYVIRDGEVVR